MKRAIVFILLLSVFVSSFAFYAFADNEPDAKLEIKYEFINNGNILVTVSVYDITIGDGIYEIGCEIDYNPAELTFLSASANVPEKWVPFENEEDGAGTEFSCLMKDGKYYWHVYTTRVGYGITENDQLSVALEFKPLTSYNASIKATCTDITSEDPDISDYTVAFASVNITPSVNQGSSKDDVVDNNTSINNNTSGNVSTETNNSSAENNSSDIVVDNEIVSDSVESGNADITSKPNSESNKNESASNDEATNDNIVGGSKINPTHKTIGIIVTIAMSIAFLFAIVMIILKRNKVIALIKENSNVIVKFWLTHVVMSILGIMVGLAVLALEGDTQGISLISFVGSAFTIGFMCFMHYDDMYFIAVKEGIKSRAEGKKLDLWKGLKLSLIAYAPVILVGFIAIVTTTFASDVQNSGVVPMLLYYVLQGSFLGLYKIHAYCGVAFYVIITLLPAIIAGTLSYALGLKDKTLRGVMGMNVKPPYDGPVQKKNKNKDK